MFSWKQNSASIFDQILSTSDKELGEESDSDSDDEQTLCISPVVENIDDGRSVPNSLSEDEINERLKRWADLTDVKMGPDGINEMAKTGGEKLPEQEGSMSNDNARELEEMGEDTQTEMKLEFKFQYLIISERLKVTIVRAFNLFGEETPSEEMETYVKVCLMPCKTHVQTSPSIQSSCNPEFNSVMFFDGLSLEEMHQMTLRVMIFGSQARGQYCNMGEVTVSLEDFDLTAENALTEDINTRICSLSRGSGSYRIKLLR